MIKTTNHILDEDISTNMLLKKTYLITTFKDIHHDFLHWTFNHLFKRDLSYFHRNHGNGETYINISIFVK